MRFSIIMVLCVFICCTSFSQEINYNKIEAEVPLSDRWSKNDYYIQEWVPEEGRFFFREVWSFDYFNEHIAEGEYGSKGTLEVYIDPITGSCLLTNNDNQLSDDMIEYIAVIRSSRKDSNAIHVIQYRTETGDSDLVLGDIKVEKMDLQTEFLSLNNGPLTMATNPYNNTHTMEVYTVELEYSHSMDSTTYEVCRLPIDLSLLGYIDALSMDLKLPINFNHRHLFPKGIFAISEISTVAGKKIGYSLKGTSDTSFFIKN